MRINIKLFLIMLIICNVNNNTFASDNDNKNPQLNQYFEERSKPIDYLTIKIITNKDTNKMEVVDPIKFTSSQLLSRFVEKTEFNNIKSIAGQDVTSITDELSKLNDKDLSINNIQNLSLGTLKFIAEGVLTYEEISPDIAMEQYNKKAEEYNKNHKEKLPILKEDEVQEARQKDVSEIEARENLQALEKEYNEIMKDNELGNDQNTREVLQIFEEALKNSPDNKLKNSLIDLFMIKDESGNIELTVTPEEMNELKKILKDRQILTEDKPTILNKFKALGNKIKNLIKKYRKKNKENNNKNEKVNKENIKKNNKDNKKEEQNTNKVEKDKEQSKDKINKLEKDKSKQEDNKKDKHDENNTEKENKNNSDKENKIEEIPVDNNTESDIISVNNINKDALQLINMLPVNEELSQVEATDEPSSDTSTIEDEKQLDNKNKKVDKNKAEESPIPEEIKNLVDSLNATENN